MPNRNTPRRGSNQPRKSKSQNSRRQATRQQQPSKMSIPRQPKAKLPFTVESVCALVDPFCKAAQGVKYPDNSSNRSLPMQLHYRTTLLSDVNGIGGTLFLPGLTYTNYTASSGSGTTLQFVSTGNNGLTQTPENYRIVNFGIILRNIIAPLNSSGMVRIRGFGATTGTNLADINTGQYNCNFYQDVSLQECTNIVIVGQRIDATKSESFVRPADTNPANLASAWVSQGWGGFVVAVSGVPINSTILDIECIVNYECVFPDSDTLQLAATKPRPPNPLLAQAASKVAEKVGNTVTDGVRAFAKQVAISGVAAISEMLLPGSGAPVGLGMRSALAITVD